MKLTSNRLLPHNGVHKSSERSLSTVFALALGLCLGLAQIACQTQPANSSLGEIDPTAPGEVATVTPAQTEVVLADSLQVLTAGPILTAASRGRFEKIVGVRLDIVEAIDSDEVTARIEAGEAFDVVIADRHVLQSLYRRGRLAELNHENLPNLRNLESRFRYLDDNPGARDTVPLEWRLLGYGYRAADFPGPPATWSYLFDSRYRRRLNGRLSSLDSMREAMGIALLYLGHSPNSADPENHRQAFELLASAKPFLFGFESADLDRRLADGELLLGQGWASNFSRLVDEDLAFGFSVPEEGTLVAVTAAAVGSMSQRQRTAEVLVDFLLRGDVAAQQANERRTASCNAMARAAIDPDLLAEIADRLPEGRPLFVLNDVGSEAEAAMRALWRQVTDA